MSFGMGTDPRFFGFVAIDVYDAKKTRVRTSVFIFLGHTKNSRSTGVKSAVDCRMAAGESSQEKESCSAWKDDVESLIDKFTRRKL